MFVSIKNFILDVLFPTCCVNCGKEGSYLCEDCQSLIEVLEYQYCPICKKRLPNLNYTIPPSKIYSQYKTCKNCRKKTKLNGLYFATVYQDRIVKKIIAQFKYQPLIKELAKPLANLIITHFQLLNQQFAPAIPPSDKGFILVPVPLDKKRLKQRGFNQSELIAQELSKNLPDKRWASQSGEQKELPLVRDALIKTKNTPAQVGLSVEERKENIRGVFKIKDKSKIKNKKILLVDDVYTTGSTMSECARVLKEAGVREVWGVVIARE